MNKYISIPSTLLVSMFLLIACNNTPKNDPNEAEIFKDNLNPATQVEQTSYGIDSLTKIVCQINERTKQKHGWYREYDTKTNVLLYERYYENDRLEGEEKIYFPSGALEVQLAYKNGQHHGPFKYLYEDGQLKQEGEYKDGKIAGMLKTYYPDGTLKDEVMHQDGLTKGPFKEYNPNGTIKAEGTFTSKSDREELEQGLLLLYDENGVLNKKMICKESTCCTIWTLEDGDVAPSSELCKGIIKSMQQSI